MEPVKIVLFSTGCAIGYGILHDQVTAHVCVEYFTIGHPTIVPTTDPTLLALVWGVVATWWVGLPLGVLAALVARIGRWPTLTLHDVRRPILVVLLGMGITSILAWVVGYLIAQGIGVLLPQPLAYEVPRAKYALFIADWWAHENAYSVGTIGGLCACAWLWEARRQRQRSHLLIQGIPLDSQFPLLKRSLTHGHMLWRRVGVWAWDRTRPAGPWARIVAVVALLIFLWGTSNIVQAWVTTPGDDSIAYSTALLGWPLCVAIAWLLGTIALFLARQWRAAALFLGLCGVTIVVGAFILAMMVGSAGVSVTEILLLMDAGIVYVTWTLLLHPTGRPSAS